LAKFRIATPRGASFTTAGDYGYELEALTPIDAEIFEVPAGSEDEFVSAARDADALYAKGRPITKRMIDGLQRCKIIALGSVGVDSVDVEAATQKGIPVTNCPDTFIDEVADHAMTLILATFRRLIVQDKLVKMLAEVCSMQLYCLRLGRLIEEGSLTDTIAAIAKMNNTRKARQVVAESRDLLGGNGILLDFHVIRHMADIEALHTYEGTETIQTLIVGRDITGVGAFA